ncbi:M-phase inducer phosphatase 1-like [Hyla sarda]|uniref:M-phase inducer phosphatase 1-like n=1 Tax=Hyla sarda TaxID=327740 RepID=UPI0024C45C74|nr:M-phase inducer phosphatase 1-like [Hyla sarda]
MSYALDGDDLLGVSNDQDPGSGDSSLDEGLSFSPDLGLSPVTCLSGNMGHLHCEDSIRRKLKLSPESQQSSPTETPCPQQTAMGTAALPGYPSELTPVLKPRICNTSDSSFQSNIYKPKKASRKVNAREHENVHRKDTRKKKARLKLLDLFQSPELLTGQQGQRAEKGKREEDGQREKNETANTECSENKRVSMGEISPIFKEAEDERDDLIGDFSKPYSLPVEQGNHQDLKYITCNTLARLLGRGYKDFVQMYRLVDCRYPYEYAGGHIKGAQNLYREDQISEFFLESPSLPQERRVVIFHCEFSSERAPKLCRILRNLDRKENLYPHLYYPELYLLKGGYKEFYETFQHLCEPQGYVKMVHKDFRDELKKYQKKKKTLSGQRIRKELFKPLTTSKGFSPVTTQSVMKL